MSESKRMILFSLLLIINFGDPISKIRVPILEIRDLILEILFTWLLLMTGLGVVTVVQTAAADSAFVEARLLLFGVVGHSGGGGNLTWEREKMALEVIYKPRSHLRLVKKIPI